MKIHIITIGKPKLTYAKIGFEEYIKRLQHYHTVRVTHIADVQNNSTAIQKAVGTSFSIALVIDAPQMSSQALADFLHHRELQAKEVSFIIGGPDGLPKDFIQFSNKQWSLSQLTFPHDLAMVLLSESLYRASSINAGQAYHR